jgi:hypothetical protein
VVARYSVQSMADRYENLVQHLIGAR